MVSSIISDNDSDLEPKERFARSEEIFGFTNLIRTIDLRIISDETLDSLRVFADSFYKDMQKNFADFFCRS